MDDSTVSEERFRYLQRIPEVHRKLFMSNFQTSFLSRILLFTCIWAIFCFIKKDFRKKKVFWKLLRKSFLYTSGMLCRHLKRSSDTGLSFNYFRIILRHPWGILLIKNEKLPVFAKRYVAKIVCKVLKKPYFEDFFDFKCL